MFAASVLLIATQYLTIFGVFQGVLNPSCASNRDCLTGQFCNGIGRCFFCGVSAPVPRESNGTCEYQSNGLGGTYSIEDPACTTYNEPKDPNFERYDIPRVAHVCANPPRDDTDANKIVGTHPLLNEDKFGRTDTMAWCEICVHATGGMSDLLAIEVDQTMLATHYNDLIGSMQWLDWVAVVFSMSVLALTMSGELKDILLCSVALSRARDTLSFAMRIVLSSLWWFRRWAVLSLISVAVCGLTLNKGGYAVRTVALPLHHSLLSLPCPYGNTDLSPSKAVV